MAFLYIALESSATFHPRVYTPSVVRIAGRICSHNSEPVLFFRLCKWLDSCWHTHCIISTVIITMAMIFRFRWRSIFGGFRWRSLFGANGPSRSNLRSGRFAGRDERQGRHSFDDWSRSRTVATSGNQLRNDD